MSTDNCAVEILHFAIAREIRAFEFYMKLKSKFTDPVLRDIMMEFAEAEIEHKEQLELELMKLGEVVQDRVYQSNQELDERFPLVDMIEEGDMTYENAILLAIDKEENDFRVYVELAGGVEDPHCKDVIVALAQQEVEHKLRWQRQYDMMKEEGG